MLGREGWELVTELTLDSHGRQKWGSGAYNMVFKRQVNQPA